MFIGKLSDPSAAAKQQAKAVRDLLASTAERLAAKEENISLRNPGRPPRNRQVIKTPLGGTVALLCRFTAASQCGPIHRSEMTPS